MNILCTRNRVQMSLHQAELRELLQSHVLEESLTFPNGQVLNFVVEILTKGPVISDQFEAAAVRVLLPIRLAQRWIEHENQRSIEVYLSTPGQGRLHVLLEKDRFSSERVEIKELNVQQVATN